MAGTVQDNIADDYLAQYNLNIGVSAVERITQFSFLQQLTYNGILDSLTSNFLSIVDWSQQIQTYSAAVSLLTPAYTSIKTLVKLNTIARENLVEINGLGSVGNLFESIQGYNKVFSISDTELQDPSSAESKTESLI